MLLDDKDLSAKYFALSVASQVTVVRDKASLRVIDKYEIRERVMQEHEEVQALNNRHTRDKKSEWGTVKIESRGKWLTNRRLLWGRF